MSLKYLEQRSANRRHSRCAPQIITNLKPANWSQNVQLEDKDLNNKNEWYILEEKQKTGILT